MVRLEAFAAAHVPAIVAASQDWPALAEFGPPYWRPRSEAEVARKIQSQAGPALASEYNFVVLVGRRLAGECSLHAIDYRNRIAQIGVALWHPDDRRQGYGSSAVQQLATWAEGYLGLRRLEAWIIDGNEASLAMFASLGFAPEGVMRSRYLCDGSWRDVHLLARIVEGYA